MKYYAELIDFCDCVLDIVSSDSIEDLREQVKKEFIPVLYLGDKIVIFEQ